MQKIDIGQFRDYLVLRLRKGVFEDRINQKAHIVSIEGDSYRIKDRLNKDQILVQTA